MENKYKKGEEMEKIFNMLYEKVKRDDAIIKEIYTFSHTVMVKSKRLGISSQWSGFPGEVNDCQNYSCYDRFIGKKVSETFSELINGSPLEVSIAMACINGCLPKPNKIMTGNVFDILYKEVKTSKTAFIGHFPRAEKWRKEGLDISIIELVPRPGDIRWDEAEKVLNRVEIVFITGITFLNKTFNEVIKMTPNAKYRALMGPSAPVAPDLFNNGVNIIGGTYIEDEELAIKYWQRGGAGMRKAPKGAVQSLFIRNDG